MMKPVSSFVRLVLPWLVAGLVAVSALAWGSSASAEDGAAIERVRAALKANYPATAVDRIEHSPFAGLFQITAGKNVFYTDEVARYMLFGHVFDMRTQADLTSQALARAVPKLDWSALPLAEAIVTKRGSGARKLAVFSDPACPHCKRLEASLAQLPDVTIHTFVVGMLGPKSEQLARAVACSANPALAWASVMRSGNVQPVSTSADGASGAGAGACSARVATLKRFTQAHQLTGVPAIVNEAGTVLRGAASVEQLEAFLKRGV